MSIRIKSVRPERIRGKFALVIEPRITPRLFEEMRRILGDTSPIAERSPLLNSIGLEYANGFLLFDSPKADDYLKRCIESLLNKAGERVAAAETIGVQQAVARQSKEDELIRAVADGFGIPIE
jgi:hypothetical protein